MEAPKRRNFSEEAVSKHKIDNNILGLELDEDNIRLGNKIKDLSLDEIKSRIPRIIFSGILLSADILYNDHLRNSTGKNRKDAAAAFLDKMGNVNLLKNLAALAAGQEAKEKVKPAKVDWGKDKKK